MDHLRLQSAFKFVAISRFGDGGQLMTAANLCLEAVQSVTLASLSVSVPDRPVKFTGQSVTLTDWVLESGKVVTDRP